MVPDLISPNASANSWPSPSTIHRDLVLWLSFFMVCGFKVNVVTCVGWCLENGLLYAFPWCRGTRRGYFNASLILQIQCLYLASLCDRIALCRNVLINITFFPPMILTSFSNIFCRSALCVISKENVH